MNHLLLASAATPPGATDAMWNLVTLGLLFAGMYFLIIAPQRQKEKELQKLLNELKRGDEVVTLGGIIGTVEKLHEDKVELKVAEKTVITLQRTAIQGKTTPAQETKKA